MTISNLYQSTKAKVATSLATLTLAGTLTLAALPTQVSGQDIPDSTQTEFIGPIESYQYQGPREFLDRYGETAFQELQGIQGRYQRAMQAEGVALGQSAQAKVISYLGEENIQNIKAFVGEVKQEAFMYFVQNSTAIQGLVQDVEAAFDGNTEGLEANLEQYIPVIEGAANLVRENATEFYQENQEFVDGIIADVQATFNDSELIAAADEFSEGMKSTLTTQFMDFYARNKPLMEQVLGDAQATFTDPEFLGRIEGYQDALSRAVLKEVMGEDFAAQVDSVEVRIERLAEQQSGEIQDLINRLELQRASQKGF